MPIVALAGGDRRSPAGRPFYVFLRYPDLGIDKGHYFRDSAVILGAALLTFFIARTARLRQGVDVDKLAAEIPPE